jgi:serine/threonine protein kinase
MLPLLRRASKTQTHLEFGFVAAVVQQTCDALHYAHELRERNGDVIGIVHRDVTPSNIFLTDAGVAKVLDFGIAKVKDASAHTQTGTVKGKYAYMAPEQLRGAEIDRRVDVFSLGVVIYEMLALRRLFQRKTDYLTFRAVMEQPMPDVRRYRPDTPEPLALAVMKALDRDPAVRYDTIRQFGTALLDATTAVKRPWSQGEISDFIRSNFVDEIAKRHAQVASAIHRTEVGRTTMPLIAHDDDTQIDERDEDMEFPSVDSTVNELPLEIRSQMSASTTGSTDFSGITPPPFGVDSSTSGASLQPLRPETPLPSPRRSLVWPLLALSMVAIAGGALFLVYKQTQQQQQPQTPIVIEQRTDPPPKIEETVPAPPPVVDPPIGSNKPNVPAVKHVITDDDAYKQAFHSTVITHKDVLNRCLTDNAGAELPTGAIVSINTDGKATDVTLTPTTANKTTLGTCLRAALQGMHYPVPASPKQLTFPFVKKPG